jgi:hypothetical protein
LPFKFEVSLLNAQLSVPRNRNLAHKSRASGRKKPPGAVMPSKADASSRKPTGCTRHFEIDHSEII